MSSKKKPDGDERFLRVQKDPRFWEMPDRERKVHIDKRFQSMFHDERFKVKYTVDKRGRPVHQTSTDDLRRFYKVSEEEEEDTQGKKKTKAKETLVKAGGGAGVGVVAEDDEDDSEEDDDEEESDVASRSDGDDEEDSDSESGLDSEQDSDSGPDLARGKGNIETSSDEDEEDEVNAVLRREEEEIEHDWGELAKDAPRSDQVSARLAVCNMDWDRMKAKDLLALFKSFVPAGGAVLSVQIFPSEFGKERMKTEETQGPLELKTLPDDSEDDTEEQRGYREKMRDYQFKRLQYFYAVVKCDSADTALKLYQECDGFEYESSCSVLDLRFIPDEVQFDEEPKDAATDVNLSAYTPKLFTSSANATSKVQLTWDETDNERVTALNRNFNKDELLAMDFNAYLASSSDGEEEEEGGAGGGARGGGGGGAGQQQSGDEDTTAHVEAEKKPQKKKEKKKRSEEQISKYRQLLKDIQDKEMKLQEDKDMEMEITWVPGLKEATEKLVKKKMEDKDQLTPWEDFLQKKKDRKKKKKKKNCGSEEGDDEDLGDDDLPPDVDLSDPFFTEELAAADVTKKKRKKKKQEDEERTAEEEEEEEEEEELQKQKAELSLLMEDEDRRRHFNYDQIVEQQNLSRKKKKQLLRKGEQTDTDHFQVDVKDPRFQAMFTSHLFNLDPSHPNYKKTRSTQTILDEKQRRRVAELRRAEQALGAQKATPTQGEAAAAGKKRENESDAPTVEGTSKKSMDPGLSLLVKSIKNKTEQFQARKKHKFT